MIYLSNKPFYFYHLFPKNSKINIDGIISPRYMLDNGLFDLFDQSTNKYRNRIVNGWKYYNKDPNQLTRDEIVDSLNRFRGRYGDNMIYFFKFPPSKILGKNMRNLLKDKIIYQIDLNNPEVRNIINMIDWGFHLSNSDNKILNRKYYEDIDIEKYYSYYDDKAKLLFANLNHISISPINGIIPFRLLNIIPQLDDFSSIEELSKWITVNTIGYRDYKKDIIFHFPEMIFSDKICECIDIAFLYHRFFKERNIDHGIASVGFKNINSSTSFGHTICYYKDIDGKFKIVQNSGLRENEKEIEKEIIVGTKDKIETIKIFCDIYLPILKKHIIGHFGKANNMIPFAKIILRDSINMMDNLYYKYKINDKHKVFSKLKFMEVIL